MKVFKDFISISKTIVQQKFCNHVNLESSSCPFTGRTYTDCLKCFKRLNVEVTK
jgi:4-hydroxy-3-methylbut-2-en-1-yl diphosphate synthase IspG/GcpE